MDQDEKDKQSDKRAENWSDEEHDHHRTERKYWFVNSVIASIAVIVAAIAAHFAYSAYSEAKRQADIAQRTLDVANKPSLIIDSVALRSPARRQGSKVALEIGVRVHNASTLPAIRTEVSASFFFANVPRDPVAAAKILCDSKGQFRFPDAALVVPGQTKDLRSITLNQDFEDIISNKAENPLLRLSSALLVGCVNFSGPNARPHYTGFIYEINLKDTGNIERNTDTLRVDQVRFDSSTLTQGFFED